MHLRQLSANNTWQNGAPMDALIHLTPWEFLRTGKKPPKNTPIPNAAVYLVPPAGPVADLTIQHGDDVWTKPLKKALSVGLLEGTTALRLPQGEWTLSLSPGGGRLVAREGFDPTFVLQPEEATSIRPELQGDLDQALQWRHHAGRGGSAKSLCEQLVLIPAGQANLADNGQVDHPYDPADLARCVGFFEAVPGARARLNDMAALSAGWAAFVPQWDALVKLFQTERENGTGKAPETYARMKELLAGVTNVVPAMADMAPGSVRAFAR